MAIVSFFRNTIAKIGFVISNLFRKKCDADSKSDIPYERLVEIPPTSILTSPKICKYNSQKDNLAFIC